MLHYYFSLIILLNFKILCSIPISKSSVLPKMASIDSSNWSLVPANSKSLMLKDFLLDDMTSCSSNGFRSFPRRQCCTTTVRFLLEIDLRVRTKTASRKLAISTISALQKASDAVLRAFKRFPFPSSRNLILRAFSKKSNVKPFKSFREFLDEKEPPSVSDAVSGRNSIGSISWTESEFTLEIIPSSSSGNSESCSENDAVKDHEDLPGSDLIGERDGVTFGEDSFQESTVAAAASAAYREESVKEWTNGEEKEQFSPVSVLDFPFEDEDQHISSSFNCNLNLIQGKKRKQMEKGGEMEPLDLKKRFQDLNLISKSKEQQREQKAIELLKLIKSSSTKSQNFIIKTENLLIDFFHEKLEEFESFARGIIRGYDFDEEHVLKLTHDWIHGDAAGEIMLMGWESPEGRNLYLRDMEMAGMWRSFAGDEHESAAELEAEIWMSLINELLIDLS